jgi:hypothetical protein
MRKTIIIFAIILFVSCKKENQDKINRTSKDTLKSHNLKIVEKLNLADTIFFSYYNDNSKYKDFALAHLIEKKYSIDSICTAKFVLDFIKNKEKVYSYPILIKGYDEGSEWYGNYELDSVSSPLKRISVGYSACGYLQNNFLFYVENKEVSLIHKWDSSSDSGWGYWGEIISGTSEDFYFRTESFTPVDETDSESEKGIIEFSDSIHFQLIDNKWSKNYKSVKGKVYRSKKQTFDEVYNSK